MTRDECAPAAVEGSISKKLLLIDDDAGLAGLMSEFLNTHGFDLRAVQDGRSGLLLATGGDFDLIILDVELCAGSPDGFEILSRLRRESKIPVIMLTARAGEEDRVTALQLGADDYLPKPFDPGELVARISAVLRRAGPKAQVKQPAIKVGMLELNPSNREVRVHGEIIDLTATEFVILDLLVRSHGRV